MLCYTASQIIYGSEDKEAQHSRVITGNMEIMDSWEGIKIMSIIWNGSTGMI